MLKSLIWWNLLEKREAFLYKKALKTDICAVRFALKTVFSFKKRNFKRYGSRFLQKRSDFHYGTACTNAFFIIDLFKDNRGTVRAFEINQSKR
jgi:hypothetical protein